MNIPQHLNLLSSQEQQQQLKHLMNCRTDSSPSPIQSQLLPAYTLDQLGSSKNRSSSLPTWQGETRKIQSSTPISPVVSVNIASLLEAKQQQINQRRQSSYDPVNPLYQKKIFLNMSTRNNHAKPLNQNNNNNLNRSSKVNMSLIMNTSQGSSNSEQIVVGPNNQQQQPPQVQLSMHSQQEYEHKKSRLGQFLQKVDSMNSSMKHIENRFIESSRQTQEFFESECSYFTNSYEKLLRELIEFKVETLQAAQKEFEANLARIEAKRAELRLFVTEISELSDDVSLNLSNILSSMSIKPFNEILDNYDYRIAEINVSLSSILSFDSSSSSSVKASNAQLAETTQEFSFALPQKCLSRLSKVLDDRRSLNHHQDAQFDSTTLATFYTHSSQIPISTNNYTTESQGHFAYNHILSETTHNISEQLTLSNKKKPSQNHNNSLNNTLDSSFHLRPRSISQNQNIQNSQPQQSNKNSSTNFQMKSSQQQENENQLPMSRRSFVAPKVMNFVEENEPITHLNSSSISRVQQQNENNQPRVNEFNRHQSIDLINQSYDESIVKKKELQNVKIAWNSPLLNTSLNYHSNGGIKSAQSASRRNNSVNASRYQSLDSQKYAEIMKKKPSQNNNNNNIQQSNHSSSSSVYQAILKGPPHNLPNASKSYSSKIPPNSSYQSNQSHHNNSILNHSHQNSMQTEFNDLNSHNISIQQ